MVAIWLGPNGQNHLQACLLPSSSGYSGENFMRQAAMQIPMRHSSEGKWHCRSWSARFLQSFVPTKLNKRLDMRPVTLRLGISHYVESL